MRPMSPATGSPDPVINTARLVLRPAGPADIDRMVAEIDDFAVAGMLARVPHPYRRSDAEDFLAAAAEANGRDLSLAITVDGRLVGGISLAGIRTQREFGYWLGRAHWGKGYATEAGQAFVTHVFDAFDIEVIRSGVFLGNDASLRVQEKLGFEKVGVRMVHCLARGHATEHIDTILTRERYESLHR